MKISYEIEGISLDESDLIRITEYYEAHCTANYLLENYDISEDLAVQLGYEIREIMSDYNCSEDMAINHVLSQHTDIKKA